MPFLFTYESLLRATNNFEKRLVVGGCGSVFEGVHHVNIVSLLGSIKDGMAPCLVVRGLSCLHSEVCVIHRVKNVNVLLDEDYRDRIVDFGIDRSLNDNNTDITYMTPEYIKGDLSTKVDAFLLSGSLSSRH